MGWGWWGHPWQAFESSEAPVSEQLTLPSNKNGKTKGPKKGKERKEKGMHVFGELELHMVWLEIVKLKKELGVCSSCSFVFGRFVWLVWWTD
jgi:hypothetical protein